MESIRLVPTAVAASHRLIGGPDLAAINPSHRGNGQRLEDGRVRFSEECLGEDAGEVRFERLVHAPMIGSCSPMALRRMDFGLSRHRCSSGKARANSMMRRSLRWVAVLQAKER